MDLSLVFFLLVVLAVGVAYLLWKRHAVAQQIERRTRSREQPITTRASVRPPSMIRFPDRPVYPSPVHPVAPPVVMSRPKAQGELRRMETAEYNGQRFYRDRDGDYYNSHGARIDNSTNPLLYAALGGLATFAVMSAFQSRPSEAAHIPYTPMPDAIPANEHSIDTGWSNPFPSKASTLEEDRVMDVPEISSFREERVSESSFREERYDSTPSFREERYDSTPSFTDSTPSFSDSTPSFSSDSSSGGSFSSE